MQFGQQDLGWDNYKWAEEDKYKFSGQPTRRMFDRYNGYQVLFLINFYRSETNDDSFPGCRQIEYELGHHLPLQAKSEISVYNWMCGNKWAMGNSYSETVRTV